MASVTNPFCYQGD